MSIHDGHRQRLKARFLQEGLDTFTDIQMLELLLFYVIPRRDTNPIAHKLLKKFGSFSSVLDAPMAQLMEDGGISENAATFIKVVRDTGRFYSADRSKRTRRLTNIEECGDYLQSYFVNQKNEVVYVLSLDAKLKVLSCRKVQEGSVNFANVPVRSIVEIALNEGATTVVLAHNHPSGLAIPSNDDIIATRRLYVALHAVDVTLFDHIVVAEDEDEEDGLTYVSMKQSNIRFDDCVIY